MNDNGALLLTDEINRKVIEYYSKALDIAISTPGLTKMECLNKAIQELDGDK